MQKLIVLSDTHLHLPGELSHLIPANERLAKGIEKINQRHPDAAACVIAGDLANRGEPQTYEAFRDVIGAINAPTYLMMGNHDNRANFLSVFTDHVLDPSGYVQQVVELAEVRLILLDSLVQGELGGRLNDNRLSWLEERLNEDRVKPTIVFVHHHVVPLGGKVDRIRLLDGDDLIELLNRYDNVAHVISGHVHMTTTAVAGRVPFTTIAGSHYTSRFTKFDFESTAERFEGPAQYAVILVKDGRVVVHFEDYLEGYKLAEFFAQWKETY